MWSKVPQSFGFQSSSPIFLGKYLSQSKKKVPHNLWNQATPPPLPEKCLNLSRKVPQGVPKIQGVGQGRLEKFQTEADLFTDGFPNL